MSGTYQLSLYNSATMALFPQNPIAKRWRPSRIATSGVREPIFAAIWQVELSFGTLEVQGENDFFESRFVAGGLYNAILSHPISGALTGFTGVAIEDCSFEFNDVDRDFWAENSRVVLSVNLQATGSF